ncbi:hypothetical protein QFZ43_004254 [Streptomyces afghaniensis]|nr:hypothetical protein [Streptomyces afghaniensis]
MAWSEPSTELWQALASTYRTAHDITVKLGWLVRTATSPLDRAAVQALVEERTILEVTAVRRPQDDRQPVFVEVLHGLRLAGNDTIAVGTRMQSPPGLSPATAPPVVSAGPRPGPSGWERCRGR